MKKKLVTGALLAAFGAVAVTGGTLAYFTDKDADINVMTAGNVKIVQNETNRDGYAWQSDDIAELMPAVYLKDGKPYNPTAVWQGPGDGADGKYLGPDGKVMAMYDKNIENEVDKVISVSNRGSLDAYIRTIILIENDANNKICSLIHTAENKEHPLNWLVDETTGKDVQVEFEGTTYSIAVVNYADPLAANKTSAPSLKQIWLDPTADNDWYNLLGEDGELSIIAFSQAVQTTGFANANDALNTAFGEVTGENVSTWLPDVFIKTSGPNNKVGGAEVSFN